MAWKSKNTTGEKKVTVYDIVTEKIIKTLEEGLVPWNKPCDQIPAMNLISKKSYKGINTMLLSWSKYTSPYWLSYKQAKDLGGFVNAGEQASKIVFWTIFENPVLDASGSPKKDAAGNPVTNKVPVLRYYSVFNTEQCTLPEGKVPQAPVRDMTTSADSVASSYADCPEIQFGNFSTGSYSEALDIVKMPVEENFTSLDDYHATLFHELAHSTGHSKRLNRKAGAETKEAEYGREKLIAEIAAAFLCYECGIERTIKNQTAYIGGWLKALKEDKRLIVTAASAAQKAVEYILRNNKVVNKTETPVETTTDPAEGTDTIPDEVSSSGDIYDLL